MTGAARARFIQTLDLVKCLADEIQNKSQLRSLCLVSKAFHDAFTPALYAEMDVVTHPPNTRPEKHTDMFERLPSNPHIRHVRRLQLDLNHAGPVNEIVRSLVERMPLLEEFEWDGGSLHQETMSALIRSCPRLKSFVMIYVPYGDVDDDMSDGDDDDETSDSEESDEEAAEEADAQEMAPDEDDEAADRTVAGMHHLARFTGLTKLTVGQMEPLDERDGEYRRWAEDIVRILVACPDLEELTLSFSKDGILYDRRCGGFLKFVCLHYSRLAARPLRLKVLRLGLGVTLRREPGTDLPVPRISDLTDIHVLEELYIDCRKADPSFRRHFRTERTELEVAAIPWDVFRPDCCPALARIGVFPIPDDLDDIPVPLLSLLQLPVDHEPHQTAVYRRPRSDNNQVALRLGGFNPAFAVPRDDVLQGQDYPEIATVTHQELEGGEWKSYLSLATNASSLYLQTVFDPARLGLKHQEHLEAMLRRTPGLRVLVLAAPLPVLDPAFHDRATTGEQMEAMVAENRENTKLATSAKWRKQLARRLAQAGRGLQIVKIGRHAWRVHRSGGGEGGDAFQLLSMDRYEQRRLGCFRPPNHAFPEFATSNIYASFGQRHEYERMMR